MDVELLHLELSVDNVILFDFNGVITQNSVVSIAKAIESTLLEADEDESRVRTIFELIVETMQNVLSYSADSIKVAENVFERRGAIVILFDTKKETYQIHSGNKIYKEKHEHLKENLEEVNSIPMDEVKDVYKERRRERRRVHSRGAGLGFLDMIRKSNNRLEYTFSECAEDDKMYFELTIKI